MCAITLLSICLSSARAETTSQFMATSTPVALNPATQFSIPATNGSISFAQIGYYENATLVNDTWVFTQLQLDSQQTDLLSSSPNTANLNVTTQDSNITLTSFERLLTPDPIDTNNTGSWLTAGWLNYSVTGIGQQILKIQFNLVNWTTPSQKDFVGTSGWDLIVNVYIDGKEAQYNNSWTSINDNNGIIPYGKGIIVNGATSNVSIEYAWVPVPASQTANPNSDRAVSSSPIPIGISITNSSLFIIIVAIPTGIIIVSTVWKFRRRI